MPRAVAGFRTALALPFLPLLLVVACSSDTFRLDDGASADGGGGDPAPPTCDADTRRIRPLRRLRKACLACVEGTCEPVTLASSVAPIRGLAVDARWIYFTVPEGRSAEVGLFRVDRRAPMGTSPERVSPRAGMFAVASDGDVVAVANHLNGGEDAPGGVYRLVGEPPLQKISDSQSTSVAVAAGDIYYVLNFGRDVGGLVDEVHVPFFTDDAADIVDVKSAGGAVFWRQSANLRGKLGERGIVTPIVERAGLSDYLVDGDQIYFTHGASEGAGGSCAGGRVGTAKLLANLTIDAPTDLDEPCARALAVDDTYVYWARGTFTARPERNTDVVRRMKKSDQTIETLAVNQPYIEQLVADDAALYWVSVTTPGGASTLTRLVK